MSWSDRHVVVTGASAGIGEALVREFAAAGSKVTVVARRKEKLDALAAELGGRVLPIAWDLSVPERSTGWIAEAEAAHGPIDVLINNAGAQQIAPTWSADIERHEQTVRLNLLTPLRLTRAVLGAMVARRAGAIVDIASMAALAPTAGMTWYNAGKAGLAGASEALRGELHGTGVHVVTVYPGIIDTDMAQAGIAAYGGGAAINMVPHGTAQVLARRIRHAVERRRARVIYPRLYVLARWFPGTTRWVMDRFTPKPVALAKPSGGESA